MKRTDSYAEHHQTHLQICPSLVENTIEINIFALAAVGVNKRGVVSITSASSPTHLIKGPPLRHANPDHWTIGVPFSRGTKQKVIRSIFTVEICSNAH